MGNPFHLLAPCLIIGLFAPPYLCHAGDDGSDVQVIPCGSPRWSPDGRRIAFYARMLQTAPGEAWETWDILIFDLNDSTLTPVFPFLWVRADPLGSSRDLVRPRPKQPTTVGGYRPPPPPDRPLLPLLSRSSFPPYDWSPDGTRLVCADAPGSFTFEEDMFIWTARSDGTEFHHIRKTDGEHLTMWVQWLRNGKIAFGTRADSWGRVGQITEGGAPAGYMTMQDCRTNRFYCSPDGKLVAFPLESDIWIYDTNSRRKRNLTKTENKGDRTLEEVAFSQDGKRLAFVLTVEAIFHGKRLWVIGIDGTGCHPVTEVQPTRLPGESAYELVKKTDRQGRYYEECSPSWSPDGKTIVYTRAYEGDDREVEIWLADADGSGHRELPIGRATGIQGRARRITPAATTEEEAFSARLKSRKGVASGPVPP